jgi:hypothetical protein
MPHAHDQWVICAALLSDAVRDETLPAAPTWEVFYIFLPQPYESPMARIFALAAFVLALCMPSQSIAGQKETIYLMGCRGVIEGGVVKCEGNCNRTCAKVVREEYPFSAYPDDLTIYDGVPTYQSPCLLLGTNPEGTEAYVLLP